MPKPQISGVLAACILSRSLASGSLPSIISVNILTMLPPSPVSTRMRAARFLFSLSCSGLNACCAEGQGDRRAPTGGRRSRLALRVSMSAAASWKPSLSSCLQSVVRSGLWVAAVHDADDAADDGFVVIGSLEDDAGGRCAAGVLWRPCKTLCPTCSSGRVVRTGRRGFHGYLAGVDCVLRELVCSCARCSRNTLIAKGDLGEFQHRWAGWEGCVGRMRW